MEVGAVKQAFNNELILLKKKLNQAKIQIINKLTRKAKTFAEKKGPENVTAKFKKKAEAAVIEVLIIKKINPKVLARFAVTHKGELNSHLNKSNVDLDKACARLFLHKVLQDKYKLLRTKFSSVPIEDLLMSREDTRKLKKEAREKKKNKNKDKKQNSKVINAEGDWDVEDIKNNNDDADASILLTDKGDNEKASTDEENDDLSGKGSDDHLSDGQENVMHGSDDESAISNEDAESNNSDVSDQELHSSQDEIMEEEPEQAKTIINSSPSKSNETKINLKSNPKSKQIEITKKAKKSRNIQNKNKNLNEKLLTRKFNKETSDLPIQESKMVDPFFITSTGENYMSVVEPRPPDEIKEVHKQGNRKLRRATMFGHVPRIKPRQQNYYEDNRFNNRQNGFEKNNKKFNDKTDFNSDKRNFTDKRVEFNRKDKDEVPEKLHPSWEAKKRQSGILPFQGKKIVFNES